MAGDLERKTQDAIINWIAETGTHSITVGLTCRHAEEDDTDNKTLPALTVAATRNEELAPRTGVHQMTVDVVLECNADDTSEATASTYLENLESILAWDDLAAELSGALSAYKCWGVTSVERQPADIVDRHWRWVYRLQLWAQASD